MVFITEFREIKKFIIKNLLKTQKLHSCFIKMSEALVLKERSKQFQE